MPDAPEITFHNTVEEVREAWRSLVLTGGYALYVDADGGLHALRLGVMGIQ
ncbi:hypothetical protein [Microbacterium sp. 1P10AE]|jgi:hypothetical protein|uniref:hypothetical protein n=1 Tax=Microbacterium sp. 1P10AE TaxID=3132286 RepID=UPI0039A0BE0E